MTGKPDREGRGEAEKAWFEAQLNLAQPSDTNYERGYDAGITAMCIALGFRSILAQALRIENGTANAQMKAVV